MSTQLSFQEVQGLLGLQSWRATSDLFSFSIVRHGDRYGASAKPLGGRMFDSSTVWLGGEGADKAPKFASFDDAVAACERSQAERHT